MRRHFGRHLFAIIHSAINLDIIMSMSLPHRARPILATALLAGVWSSASCGADDEVPTPEPLVVRWHGHAADLPRTELPIEVDISPEAQRTLDGIVLTARIENRSTETIRFSPGGVDVGSYFHFSDVYASVSYTNPELARPQPFWPALQVDSAAEVVLAPEESHQLRLRMDGTRGFTRDPFMETGIPDTHSVRVMLVFAVDDRSQWVVSDHVLVQQPQTELAYADALVKGWKGPPLDWLAPESRPSASPRLLQALRDLDQMRRGLETDLDEVERVAAQLAVEFPQDVDRIEYQLAFVHAQTGLQRPDRLIEHAQLAWTPRQSTLDLARLACWWGDAVPFRNRGVPLTDEVRNESASAYVKGLAALDLEQLPGAMPALPDGPGIERSPAGLARNREYQRVHSWAREIEETINMRDVLIHQLRNIYGPRLQAEDRDQALADLAAIAAEHLPADAQVELLRLLAPAD